jgi:hypothetical protein
MKWPASAGFFMPAFAASQIDAAGSAFGRVRFNSSVPAKNL